MTKSKAYNFKYVAIFILFFWMIVVMYLSISVNQSSSNLNDSSQDESLLKALNELDTLRKQNEELQNYATELRSLQKKLQIERQLLGENKDGEKNKVLENIAIIKGVHEPGLDHEENRRKVEMDVNEMWYYLQKQLSELKNDLSSDFKDQAKERIGNMESDVHGYYMTALNDLFNLSVSNDAGDWRAKEANDLTQLVQERFYRLQNPSNCSNAKFVLCSMNKGCGYGCQIHHVAFCFIIAYGTGRTMVVNSRGWRYAHDGWEKFFLPVSETCRITDDIRGRLWSGGTSDVRVVELPIIDALNPRPPYLPQSIPSDLAERLMRLHGHPFVWWIGQILKYLLRPQPSLVVDMKATEKKLGFYGGPIVGVHIRRTDKVGSEASFHGLDEYMKYVNDYFDLLDLRKSDKLHRRIYLATDDPKVFEEARQKYTQYEVIGDNGFSKTAALDQRYTETSLRAIILDVHFLSQCDYLVCTFSSQVCRLAYEIMQTLHPDASSYFKSLDDIYYFGGQHGHTQVARAAHNAKTPEEIELLPGDYIGIAGNHWDGYSLGRNRRTGAQGLYPSYKALEFIQTAVFPGYRDHKNSSSGIL